MLLNDVSAQTVFSHSTDQNGAAGSIACQAAGITRDNHYYREYDFANDFATPGSVSIDAVEFSVESVTGAGAGFTVDIRLYTVAAPGLPTGVLTPLANTTATLQDAMSGTVVQFPITGAVANPGDVVVVEIDVTASTTTGFFIGSNGLGESDAGYIRSDSCAISTITDLTTVGFPNMHMILNLISNSVGVDEHTSGSFSIFPNPAESQITINSNNSIIENITIIDVAGKTVSTLNVVNSTRKNIDVSDLETGVYFIQVQTDNGLLNKKFIKE